MREHSGGLGMANGAEACERALNLLGVKRIGVLTPYWASTSSHVIRFFSDAGFEVVRHKDLECPSPVAIAHVEADRIQAALREIDSDQVEAIVQCGTDLHMVELADEAEKRGLVETISHRSVGRFLKRSRFQAPSVALLAQ
jgi:maleate isomerase